MDLGVEIGWEAKLSGGREEGQESWEKGGEGREGNTEGGNKGAGV